MKRSPARRKYHRSSTIYTRSRKYSSYKRTKRTGAKTKKKLAVAVSTIALVVFSLLFIVILGFYKKLSANFVSADSATSADFNSQSLVTILYVKINSFNSDPVLVTSIKVLMLNKEKSEFYIYDVPVSYKIAVGKFRNEELSKSIALARLQGETASIITTSINKLFAYPIDKYFIAEENIASQTDDMLENVNLLSLITLSHPTNFKTDLTLSELLNFINSAKMVNKDNKKLKVLSDDLSQSTLLIETDLKELNFDSLISQEKKSISVLNGTDSEGIAALGARVVANLGGRVISASNTQTAYSESLIVADDTNSETVRRLVKFFNITKIVPKTAADYIKENEIDRSDVTLILGSDSLINL